VAVARALVHRPRLLLCDEPTGNLDTENSDAVLDLLRRVTREQDVATVIITHDLNVAAGADRIVCVVDGHTAAAEPAAALGGQHLAC
jgi:putative ABC transport system ATP-binding protein